MGHPNAEFKTQEEIDRSLLEWKSADDKNS